ncbi:exopolysaccharide biosynthesis protein [Nibricoccus sp. IMCC34717]|uniref:exopolysaccharide biosynthesis protein n=1 Tax=Nibricoccus sp. IMCC34717 TaxID=3034021 RepID=UPI003850168F
MIDKQHASSERIHLSNTLDGLSKRFADGPVTVADVLGTLGSNASALLVVLLCLPFCAPVTIPGTSTPSGLVAAFIAGRFALGLPPWLPQRLLRVSLPPRFFELTFRYAGKFIGWIERGLKPRWAWYVASPAAMRVHAIMICIAGLLLALPLPPVPPLTNTLPAWAVVIGMLGLIERDGRAVFAAWLVFVFTLAYFTAALLLGSEIIQWVKGLVG